MSRFSPLIPWNAELKGATEPQKMKQERYLVGHHLLALLALLWTSKEHLSYHILIAIGIWKKLC